MAAEARFYLAWHQAHLGSNLALTSPGAAYCFVLVPEDFGHAKILWVVLDILTANGRPAGTIYGGPIFLASPRDPEVTQPGPCPREVALIEALRARAGSARHRLPDIVPTLDAPSWAKLQIPRGQRGALLRAGGA